MNYHHKKSDPREPPPRNIRPPEKILNDFVPSATSPPAGYANVTWVQPDPPLRRWGQLTPATPSKTWREATVGTVDPSVLLRSVDTRETRANQARWGQLTQSTGSRRLWWSASALRTCFAHQGPHTSSAAADREDGRAPDEQPPHARGLADAPARAGNGLGVVGWAHVLTGGTQRPGAPDTYTRRRHFRGIDGGRGPGQARDGSDTRSGS